MKNLLFRLSMAIMLPLYLVYRVNRLFVEKESAIQGLSQLVSLLPGQPGNYLRKGFYALTLKRCSADCTISFGTILSTPECEIGRHVYIGAYCVISDSVIGDDTLLGSHVHVVSGKHAHGFEGADVPIRLQKSSRRAIRIGSNSWIGNGAIVMDDVGVDCVIGAGSVVTKPVAEGSVAAGNPARLLRKRTDAVAG